MLSNEAARVENGGVKAPSLAIETTSSSRSSGGLSRISRGLRLKPPYELNSSGGLAASSSSRLSSFSEIWERGTMESTVMRTSPGGLTDFWREAVRRLGGGIEVIARRAAMEGETASEEWTSRALRV